MAKSLDELLRLKGVIAAGEFWSNGKLLDFRSKGALLLGVLAAGHGRMSGVNLVPEQGWMYSGGDLTIAVGRGVFAKTAEAEFNQLFTALASDSTQGLCLNSSDHLPSNLTPLASRAC